MATDRRERWCPGLQSQMREDLLDHRLFQNRRDDLKLTATVWAVLHFDLEHTLEQLGHAGQLTCSRPALRECPLMADAGYSVSRVRRHTADVRDPILTGRFGASSSESRSSEVGQKRILMTVRFKRSKSSSETLSGAPVLAITWSSTTCRSPSRKSCGNAYSPGASAQASAAPHQTTPCPTRRSAVVAFRLQEGRASVTGWGR